MRYDTDPTVQFQAQSLKIPTKIPTTPPSNGTSNGALPPKAKPVPRSTTRQGVGTQPNESRGDLTLSRPQKILIRLTESWLLLANIHEIVENRSTIEANKGKAASAQANTARYRGAA